MLKNEWKAILRNKFFIVIMIALALIPALYNWIFLSSMWNPYGELKNLPVAVVNLDKTSELNGKTLQLGTDVSKEMKKTKDLDYHFVSQETAKSGLKDGKYYVVITFPKDFSKNAASLMTAKPQTMQLTYQTSQGHNYISSKMGESAMNQLKAKISKEVTQNYTKAIFDNLSTLKSGMKEASDGSAKLADATQQARSGSATLSSNLTKLAQSSLVFSDGTSKLQAGLGQYLPGVLQAKSASDQLTDGAAKTNAGAQQVSQGLQTLAGKSQNISDGLSNISASTAQLQKLQAGSQALLDGLSNLTEQTNLSEAQVTQLKELQEGLTALNTAIKQGSSIAPATLSENLKAVATSAENIGNNEASTIAAVQNTQAFKGLTAEQQAEILAPIKQGLGQNQAELLKISQSAQNLSAELQTMAAESAKLQAGAALALPQANATFQQFVTNSQQLHSALANQIRPGASQISQGLKLFNSGFGAGSSQLASGFSQFQQYLQSASSGAQQVASGTQQVQSGSAQLSSGLGQLSANNAELSSGSAQLTSGAAQLSDGSAQLAAGGNSLFAGLDALNSGTNKLAGSLNSAHQSLSKTSTGQQSADRIAAPLELKHTDSDNTPVNGVGMTPYMMCVALFVGAMTTNIILGSSISGKQWKNGRDFVLAKIGTNGVVAVAQALIVIGAVYALGLRANYGGRMIFGTILISLAFMALVTFFNVWLGKVGAFLMLLMLIIQLAASAGTYPLQLSSKIFQAINPWIPMTYAIRLLRQVISLQGDIWAYVLILAAIAMIFTALLGLFRRKVSV